MQRNHPRHLLENTHFKWLILFSAIALTPLFWRILFEKPLDQTAAPSPCKDHFQNNTYPPNSSLSARTILIGETHHLNEPHIAACLETMAAKGDHLLIESPDQHKEIPCDTIHPSYKRFNGKLKCYGFDASLDEARRTYSDLAYRANFIVKNSPYFFVKATSSQDVIANMIEFADKVIAHKTPTSSSPLYDPSFNKRNGKYIKKLAKRMRGLTIQEMQAFLIKENNRLADKSDSYEQKSRLGPTNQKLVTKIVSHRAQLQSGQHRLFAIAGTRHLDLDRNLALRDMISSSKEPIIIMTPKVNP